MGRESADNMLPVQDAVRKLFKVDLRLKFSIKGETEYADVVRRRYVDAIHSDRVYRVLNVAVDDALRL